MTVLEKKIRKEKERAEKISAQSFQKKFISFAYISYI